MNSLSTLIKARRIFSQSAITIGTDAVVGGVWLPAGSILAGVKGDVQLVGPTELTLGQVVSYGLEGWILPMEDPDSGVTMNALWDSHVPKDTVTELMDLDADAADATPFYEPGSIAWEFLFDIGMSPRRILHRHKFVTAASGSFMTRQDVETPFTEHWFPGAVERVNITRPYRVKVPSLAVFAVAVPDTLQTSATDAVGGMPETDWGRVKFIDTVMEQAMMSLLGLTESGAETPWVEAASLLRQYMDPAVLENNAGSFAPTVWGAHGELVFDVVVPGSMKKRVLSGGR